MNSKDSEANNGEGELPDKKDEQLKDKNQKEVTKVTSVLEFLKWVEELGGTKVILRGHGCCEWKVESSASRLFRSKTSENSISYTKSEISHNRKIINDAKMQGIYDNSNSATAKNDWGILAQQQHIGAATSLLDFSSSPLVPLFFACQICPKKYKCECIVDVTKCDNCQKYSNKEICKCHQKGGNVFSIELGHPDEFDEFDSLDKLEKHKIEDIIHGYKSTYWKPAYINNRIFAQHSYFIIGGRFEGLKKCFIPEENKEDILVDLYRFYDIKRITLFPDEAGLAEANSINPKYTVVYLEYLEAGLNFHRNGEYEQAIEIYTKIIDDDKYKNHYKRQAYNHRGFARVSWGHKSEKSGETQKTINQYELGIKDFNEGIRIDKDIMIKKIGEIQETTKQYEVDIKDFNKGIRIDEGIMIKKISGIQETIRQYKAGIKDFNQGIIFDEMNTIKEVGKIQEIIKQYEEGVKDFNDGIVLDKDIIIKEPIDTIHQTTNNLLKDHFNLGLINMQLANFYKTCGNDKKCEYSLKEVITHIKKVLYYDNNHAEAHSLLAVAWTELGEYEMALNNINAALKIDPNSYHVYLDRVNIRRIQIASGKLKIPEQLDKYCMEIIIDCDMVISMCPNCYEAYIYRALANATLGNSKGTIKKDFDTVLKIKQGETETNYAYGVTLFTLACSLEIRIVVKDKDAYEEIIKIYEESLIHLEIFNKKYPTNKDAPRLILDIKDRIINHKEIMTIMKTNN